METVKFENDSHFEERVVQALLVDHSFAEQIIEVLNVDYFNIDYLKEITKIIFEHYHKHKSFPSVNLLSFISKNLESDLLKQQIKQYIAKIKREPLNGDLEYVKEFSLDFCKKRSLAIALEHSLDLIQEKKYEQITGEIQKALIAGSEKDIGHLLVEDFDKRMTEVSRNPVYTPWDEINNIIKEGGPSGGELNVICASTSTGKSHCLVDIGSAAALNGLNVVHYTLELSAFEVGNRYDSRLSGIPSDLLREHKEEVRKKINEINGKIVIRSYPTKSITIQSIKSHLHTLIIRDIKPDLIVVDYGDLMRSQHKYELKRLEEESAFEDLRALSQETNTPVWTATQSNRESVDAEVVTLKHVAECFAKVMVSDLFITMQRYKENGLNNTGNFFVAKNRHGLDGIKFPILINTATSKVQVLPLEKEADVPSNQNTLKKKYKDFKKIH